MIISHSSQRQVAHAANLSQRKNFQIENEEEKKKENAHKKETDEMMHTIFNLKQRINDFESQEQVNENNSRKLVKLYDMKIIN